MTNTRAVISDLGRVIVDFDNWIFLRKMEAFSPLSAEDMMARVHGRVSLLRRFDSGSITPDEFYEEAVSLFQADIDKSAFFDCYVDVFTMNPEALAVLQSLKGRYRLVMLSNTDVKRYGFISRKFPQILFFDAYVLSYQAGVTKPDPEIYLLAVKAARAKAGECVFIDDLEKNITAAKALGIHTFHMTPGADIARGLRDLGLRW